MSITTPVIVRGGAAPLRQAVDTLKNQGERIGFVPTMGCLHEGHLSLVKAGVERGERVVISIFVNPTQFGPNEDLASYPRTETRDIELSTEAGASIIWIPTQEDLYPTPGGLEAQQIKVVPGSIAHKLCGASRPVFFTGICTVVLKLFNIVRPDSAYFGEKDYQQLQIIRTMVDEFLLEIDVVGCPLIREPDGLAMSSRNVRIPKDRRHIALHLSQTLRKAQERFAQNARKATLLIEELSQNWPEELELDYLDFRCPRTLEKIEDLQPDTRLFLGAWLKDEAGDRGVRLIDNAALV